MSDGKIIHVKKFAGGRETPQEMHARVAWAGRRCAACKGPPAIRIKVFAPVAELVQRSPQLMGVLAARAGGNLPVVPTTAGNMLKTSDLCFCALCAPTAERVAAKGPSWAIVEIDRGPDPTNRVATGYRG